jgi:hypothetical protein
MNFEEATERLCAALAAGDLDAAEQALRARGEALSRGARPGSAEGAAGQHALLHLEAMKRRLAYEGARLRQLKTAIAGAEARPHIECRG